MGLPFLAFSLRGSLWENLGSTIILGQICSIPGPDDISLDMGSPDSDSRLKYSLSEVVFDTLGALIINLIVSVLPGADNASGIARTRDSFIHFFLR